MAVSYATVMKPGLIDFSYLIHFFGDTKFARSPILPILILESPIFVALAYVSQKIVRGNIGYGKSMNSVAIALKEF